MGGAGRHEQGRGGGIGGRSGREDGRGGPTPLHACVTGSGGINYACGCRLCSALATGPFWGWHMYPFSAAATASSARRVSRSVAVVVWGVIVILNVRVIFIPFIFFPVLVFTSFFEFTFGCGKGWGEGGAGV